MSLPLLQLLEKQLAGAGHRVFTDRHLRTGMEWASEIQREVRGADAVIALLSVASIGSEMLEEEIRVAHEAAQAGGKPNLLPMLHWLPLPARAAAIFPQWGTFIGTVVAFVIALLLLRPWSSAEHH